MYVIFPTLFSVLRLNKPVNLNTICSLYSITCCHYLHRTRLQ